MAYSLIQRLRRLPLWRQGFLVFAAASLVAGLASGFALRAMWPELAIAATQAAEPDPWGEQYLEVAGGPVMLSSCPNRIPDWPQGDDLLVRQDDYPAMLRLTARYSTAGLLVLALVSCCLALVPTPKARQHSTAATLTDGPL